MPRGSGHPSRCKKKSPVGVTRAGVVYELFFTNLPQRAFTASDVVELYLHRGAFEPALSDEDQEIDPDRGAATQPGGRSAGKWCRNGCGTSGWSWGIGFEPDPYARPSLLLPSRTASSCTAALVTCRAMAHPRRPCPGKLAASRAKTLLSSPMGRYAVPRTRRCVRTEQRREADGSLRVVYAASIRSCRPCPLREQCQWHGAPPRSRARSVSSCILSGGSRAAPLAGLEPEGASARLSPACAAPTHRGEPAASAAASPRQADVILSRAQRAHSASHGSASGSQCTFSSGRPGHDQTVRGPRRFC